MVIPVDPPETDLGMELYEKPKQHRIPKGNWIIEEDRRLEQDGRDYEKGTGRKIPHDYSKPQRIALVKVEPEPVFEDAKGWKYKGRYHSVKAMEFVLFMNAPFSQNDILELEDEWANRFDAHVENFERAELWTNIPDKYVAQYDKEPPSTMPAHLNSFAVGQVVGVERREIKIADFIDDHYKKNPMAMKTWMFKILEKE